MGFILALTAIASIPEVSQAVESPGQSPLSVRLNNLNVALQQRANQLPKEGKTATPNGQSDLLAGFANRSGGGGFGNARRGGFANGGGGTFVNANRGGGWGDGGGGFLNRNWPNGGGFVNRW